MTPPQDSVSDVERLQRAWDTCDTLPPIYFTKDEAQHIIAALAVPINKIGEDAKDVERDRAAATKILDALNRRAMPRFQALIWEERHRILALMFHGEIPA